MERVVVTGLGLVTPLGCGVSKVWPALLKGASGIVALSCNAVEAELPARIAGLVPEASIETRKGEWKPDGSGSRAVSRSANFALMAAEEALNDSGLSLADEAARDSTGVAIGSGISDLDEIAAVDRLLAQGKARRISPYFVPRILTNMGAGHLSIKYGLRGPNHSVATACTTGAHSLGDAANFIRLGMAKAMVCGGSEACVNAISLAGFSRCRALATAFNDRPTHASRPFDDQREGFVMSEGAGVVVLESLSSAQARGARIHAEVLGYGLSGDGHHLTSPDPQGRGAQLCMRMAFGDFDPADIGYVNAHATSTPAGDEVEAAAIGRVIGSGAVVSSTKGSLGHLLGAAGAVEAIISVLCLSSLQIPPNLNLSTPISVPNVTLAPAQASTFPRAHARRLALSNSFGFGGTNILCLHGYRQNAATFRLKTGGMRKFFKSVAELEYMTASHPANLAPEHRNSEEKAEDEEELRGWWHSSGGAVFHSGHATSEAGGFAASVAAVAAHWAERGPFDGILGFSQGATLAHLLCRMAEEGELPAFRPKFAILISGFRSRSEVHARLYENQLRLPSLHIFGENDAVISKERAQELAETCESAVRVVHGGGHFVPTLTSFKPTIFPFLAQFACSE